MIEIRHLRSLIAIADARTLSAAADRVHLTQSALSHQLRAIEDHYEVKLFERSREGLKATRAGARFIALARDVVAQVGDAERDLERLNTEARGELRIVLECHTCFDWLMPVMDEFRRRWPEVEIDLVAGFHADPLGLIANGKADVVIGSERPRDRAYSILPLFEFEILLVLPLDHPLRARARVDARDLRGETLITYPVPPDRIDMISRVLEPAGVKLPRRTAELTIAILQLVASRRGVAALPSWGVRNYVDHDYVIAKRIGKNGLWSRLYAVAPKTAARKRYMQEFVEILRDKCSSSLEGIRLL